METSINDVSIGEINPDQFANYLISCKGEYSVTRVSYISGFSQVDLPVAIAYRPNSKVLSQSGGKGISQTQALISALMESYECDAAENIKPDMYEVSYKDLNNYSLSPLDPHNLPTTLSDYSHHAKIDWSEGYDLFTNQAVLIPFDAVSLDFTRMTDLSRKCYIQLTSNGLASGQTVTSAIISALLEIIERHSVTTAELNNTTECKEVDLYSLPDSIKQQLISKFQPSSVIVKLYYVSIFAELPVYCSIIVDANGQGNVGWGCHPDDNIAIARAITEANQARTIQISGSREDMHRYDYMMLHKLDQPDTSILKRLVHYTELISLHSNPTDLSMEFISEIWTKLGLPNPLVKVLCKDERKAAVRVVVPFLHGYNYPAYKSILRHNYTEQLSDYMTRVTHRPAAI
jgi:ribosomal protein S12 methylthiotransferase accessory factor